MTGFALATLVVAAALTGVVRALRHFRRAPPTRPLVLARAGGRAFAAHLGSLSHAGTGLEVPTVPGAWRRLGPLASGR
jgi:hypothetical protein